MSAPNSRTVLEWLASSSVLTQNSKFEVFPSTNSHIPRFSSSFIDTVRNLQWTPFRLNIRASNSTHNVSYSNFDEMAEPEPKIQPATSVTLLKRSISRSSRSGLFVLFIAGSFIRAALQGMIIFPDLTSVQVWGAACPSFPVIKLKLRVR